MFNENKVVPHIKSYAQDTLNSWNKKLAYYRQLGAKIEVVDKGDKECKSELYIEPLDWFKDRLATLNGKVS